MFKLADLWRTTTVRLTATFVLIFVLFSVLLLGIISYQSSIQIQRQQTADIDREVAAIVQIDKDRGFRATIIAVERLSRMPGPGIYFLGDPTGQRVVGNVETLPPEAITAPGVYSFDYDRSQPFGEAGAPRNKGNAVVRSVALDSGLLLVVGRDVVEQLRHRRRVDGAHVIDRIVEAAPEEVAPHAVHERLGEPRVLPAGHPRGQRLPRAFALLEIGTVERGGLRQHDRGDVRVFRVARRNAGTIDQLDTTNRTLLLRIDGIDLRVEKCGGEAPVVDLRPLLRLVVVTLRALDLHAEEDA